MFGSVHGNTLKGLLLPKHHKLNWKQTILWLFTHPNLCGMLFSLQHKKNTDNCAGCFYPWNYKGQGLPVKLKNQIRPIYEWIIQTAFCVTDQ